MARRKQKAVDGFIANIQLDLDPCSDETVNDGSVFSGL